VWIHCVIFFKNLSFVFYFENYHFFKNIQALQLKLITILIGKNNYKKTAVLKLLLLSMYGAIQLNGQSLAVTLKHSQSFNFLADTSKQQKLPLIALSADLPALKRQQPVLLFKTMPNCYRQKQRLPLFCEIEHQLSKLIKRRVKLGVP